MASGYSDLSEIRKDGRFQRAYPKPAKIDLLNEQPRRESVVENQLTTAIVRPGFIKPHPDQPSYQQQVFSHGSQQNYAPTSNQHPSNMSTSGYNNGAMNYGLGSSFQQQQQQMMMPGPSSSRTETTYSTQNLPHSTVRTEVTTSTTTSRLGASPSPIGAGQQSPHRRVSPYDLAAEELAEKEAKLRKEMAYFNLYHNQWSRPKQIRDPRREPPPRAVRVDHRWVKDCPSGPSSRPTSRASSTRSTTEADLMERADKLLQDVAELESKPLSKQQLIIETSKVKDVPVAEDSISSVHTAVIKAPRGEIDNKSPLPFAFDNFSTLGIRGNIASVGAAEPEKPYPPIFPTIKKSPSPANLRR